MQEILSRKDIGERIKALRVDKGLSQAYIAKILNLSRSNYSQIELGNQYPTFTILHAISRYYSKSYDWLLHGITVEHEVPEKLAIILHDLDTSYRHFSNMLKRLEHELKDIKVREHKLKG
jgi:transcriptional regulator with XRE-family HTH domain